MCSSDLFLLVLACGLDQGFPLPGFVRRTQATWLRRAQGMPPAFVGLWLGGLTPLLPCGPLHALLGLALLSGGAARGVTEFTDKEITSALQLPVCGSIVHDPVAAAQLSDGVGQRFDKSRLARSLSKVAGVLVDVIGRRRADSKEDL